MSCVGLIGNEILTKTVMLGLGGTRKISTDACSALIPVITEVSVLLTCSK